MQQIIKLEDLGNMIEQTIEQVRQGVNKATQSGVIARMPEDLSFDVLVVTPGGWDVLKDQSSDSSQGKESNHGESSEKISGEDNSQSNQVTEGESSEVTNSSQKSDSEQNGSSTALGESTSNDSTHTEETVTSTDTTTQSETGADNSTSTRSGNDYQETRNTHVQRDKTSLDYGEF